MKKIKTYIPSGLLLLATLISASPAFAVAPVVVTGAEYHAETYTSSRGGTVEAVYDGSNERWELTAVPADSVWMFVKWNDGNTENPRYISLGETDPMSKTYTAQFAVWVYQNCYSQEEYYNLDQTKAVNDTGRIVVTQPVAEGPYYLEAVPEEGYTFVQWADGSYENPRVFEPTEDAATTIYATFIPDSTAGLIDSWSKEGFVIKTTSAEGDLRSSLGALLVYYDGELMTSAKPTRKDWGVYSVSATYDSGLAGKQCHIVYKLPALSGDTCIPVATLDAMIPVLVDDEETVVVPNSSTGVHVLNGGVATLSGTQTIADLDVYAGGKAVVAGTISTSSVTMRSDAPNGLRPSLLVQGTLNNLNNDTIYYDYRLDYYAYYPFALPYTVNTENVSYRSGANAYTHYIIGCHNGTARAEGLSYAQKWPDYYDYESTHVHKDLVAGTGYSAFAEPESWYHEAAGIWRDQTSYWAVIRFPMKASIPTGGVESASIPVSEYPSENKSNRNWNFLGSPYLSAYDGPIALYDGDTFVQDVNYLTIPTFSLSDYDQPRVGDVPLQPFQSFFIQFDNDITVDNVRFASPDPSARMSAPARRLAKAANSDKIKAGITLSQNGKKDHTALLISEEYTADYDFNADLSKMFGKTPKRANVFSLLDDKKLAYSALPPADGTGMVETVIPLGYSNAVVGGEMTFALDDDWYPQLRYNENVSELNLIDKSKGVTTNLLTGSYTCTADSAASDTRFALGISYVNNAPQITTGCEEIRATALPDGIYDLMGRRINGGVSRNAGVYIIIENGKARKEVIR